MICSEPAVDAQELSKQDNTSNTCATDLEQIIILLANITVNKITEIITCSKSTVNASGSCKQNDTKCVYWWYCIDLYVVETYAMTSKY